MILDYLKVDQDSYKQYLMEQWNVDYDFKESATAGQLAQILAGAGMMNIGYILKSFQNAVFSDAFDRNVVVKKARSEKGYKAIPLVSAYVLLKFTLDASHSKKILIPKWTMVTTEGIIPQLSFYTVVDSEIPIGELETTVIAVEGVKQSKVYLAQGIEFETFQIRRSDVTLREIEVNVNDYAYTAIEDILDAVADIDPSKNFFYSWTYEPSEENYINIMFGDGYYGNKLAKDDTVNISYLISNGKNGVVKPNVITNISTQISDDNGDPVNNIVCTNNDPSFGGCDFEDIDDIKQHSYNKYRSNWSLALIDQYQTGIRSRQGVDRVLCLDINTSLDVPFRQVWAYIVDVNGDAVADPYKKEIEDWVYAHQIIGNEFMIKDVKYKNYDVMINLWVLRGFNANEVRGNIQTALIDQFGKKGMSISTTVEVENIGAVIQATQGVAHYDVIMPTADVIVPLGYLANIASISVVIKGVI